MDDRKEYIESGILELYVLGELNVEEQAKVEAMVTKFPELKQEIEAIEIALEQYALQNSINPTGNLIGRISSSLAEQNVVEKEVSARTVTKPMKEASVFPFNPDKYKSKIKTLSFALAACISLLILSVAALYFSYSQLGTAKDRIFELQAKNEQFTRTVNYLTQHNFDLKTLVGINNDPAWKVVNLNGTSHGPQSKHDCLLACFW